jgi:serine/threonine protein kinase
MAYMPPEVLSSKNSAADPMIDVWGIGCMLYSMIMNRLPFWGET